MYGVPWPLRCPKVTLVSFGALVSKWHYNSKTLCYRPKRTEIWDSEPLVTHILGAFDAVVFKVIWAI